MRSNIILFLLTINLLLLPACNKDKSPFNDQSFRSITQENELNHLKLEFTASNAILESNKTISFTSDTILVQLTIAGHEGEGTGDINLYQGDSNKGTTFSFNSDTLLTDTLINMLPDKATISLWKFTGRFGFQLDGK